MASPLMITVLAAVMFGERLGPSRWLAVSVGFVGVLFIIQPQADGFDGYALVCLLSTLLLSVRDLVTRRVHATVPSILVTLSNTIAVTLFAALLSVFESWRAFSFYEIGYLAVVAVFLSTAYYLLVVSTRHGDLSLIAPFRYSALLFAAIAGFIVWGDVPNALAWGGIALVIASGIYVLRVSRRARRAPITPD
jgi:drug/metabolite transporter (DMT)-like permease